MSDWGSDDENENDIFQDVEEPDIFEDDTDEAQEEILDHPTGEYTEHDDMVHNKQPFVRDSFIFQKIAQEGQRQNIFPGANQKAINWYRNKAQAFGQVDSRYVMSEASERGLLQQRISNYDVGSMFLYFYDAKLKEELPFWDRFPMIFVMETYSDGFLGMNLHYLPIQMRASLMDQLYSTMSNQALNQNSQLQTNYYYLKSLSRFRFFTPCIKRYLYDHVRSYYIKVNPEEWDIVLMLPLQRFQKKSSEFVWNNSRQKLTPKWNKPL